MDDLPTVSFDDTPPFRWRPTSEPPRFGQTVWGYLPTVGNDDEGYGYVEVVRVDYFGKWVNAYGNLSPVTHWAEMDTPNAPFPVTAAPPTPAEIAGE
jgi:hypothetical protein